MYSHYSVPSPGYQVPYGYATTPPLSPSPHGPQVYYSPRYSMPTASPASRGSPKKSSRRASQESGGYTYAIPRAWHSSPGYPPQAYYSTMPEYTSPQRSSDHVSYPDRLHSKARRSGMSSGKTRRASQSDHVYVYYEDDAHHYDSYARREQPPPYQYHREADQCAFYEQVPVYTEAEPTIHRSRARRPSQPTRPTATPKASKPPPAKPAPKATEEDARRAHIPAGYSYKNWDPTEEPIMLLGSVFDANSLGKWIYDWTVFHHGAATPMAEVAGELWLLLIQIAGKIKRAEECMPRIRKEESRELVDDFLESGERIWSRFRRILKSCEEFMMKAAKRDGKGKGVSMGKNSGCEFVDSIFGRDRELERTEKLMTGMRLWSMRYDVNCEDILRHPTA
ncbi:MAG: hypothetical protein M1835_007102 [Candelina submexicana]|nr:MAG: hypothetical protein M1835_007102 [Candelina submexicana]